MSRRHNGFRDALANWLVERYGREAVTMEQCIPSWDYYDEKGYHQAVLDIVLSFPGGRVCVDVTCTEALAPEGSDEARRRVRVPGAAARGAEGDKHLRYPGPGLVCAAVESGGRFGGELQALLKAHVPAGEDVRAEALADVRQRLAVAAARGTPAKIL